MSETSSAPASDDVRADLEAVLAEAEKSAPVERPAPAPRAAPKAEPEPVEEEAPDLVPPSGDRPRDQFGRYTKTLDATAEAPAKAADEPAESEPIDQPAIKVEEPAQPAIAPPQSWSSSAKDEWARLPRAVQDEVHKRESDVARGFQERAQQINDLQPIAQVLQPYAQKLAMRGIHPATAVQQLLAVQDLLDRDPIEGVAHVARSYGVDLRQYAAAFQQAQQPQDPQVQAVQQKLSQIEGYLQQSAQAQQQQEMARITQEIDAFRADTASHPYFEAVRPAMAQLMQHNMALSLQDAYDHAVWSIPEVRTRILEDQRRAEQNTRATAEKQAAERARRAAVSVSGTPTSGKGAKARESHSVREDIERVLEQLASR